MPFVPNDPLYGAQWHFTNLGMVAGVKGIERIWEDYRGEGIFVGVYDSGVQLDHPDLDDNFDGVRDITLSGVPYRGGVADLAIGDPHGTGVAGLLGAEGNNDTNGIGVAFEVSMSSIHFQNPGFVQSTNFDIANMSIGLVDAALYQENLVGFELVPAVNDGRGGLGTVVVRAAGNSHVMAQGNSANASGFTISVSATLQNGFLASYSNYGANILVSAAGSGDPGSIFTTDFTGSFGSDTTPGPAGDYTTHFNGTSAATPMVSGVAALMLDANPFLGWRDVQDILAQSAMRTGSAMLAAPTGNETSTWRFNDAQTWNGGGYHFSNDYGYGRVDVFAAVRLAEAARYIGHSAQTSGNEIRLSSGPLADTTPLAATIFVPVQIDQAIEVDHVSVTLDITEQNLTNLRLSLLAPSGFEVVLHDGRTGLMSGADASTFNNRADGGMTWTWGAEAFRGHLSEGLWRLKVVDPDFALGRAVNSIQLDIHGGLAADDDVYVYTGEFGAVRAVSGQSGRDTLSDDAGDNWFNSSALFHDTVLNMAPGSVVTNGGNPLLTLSATTRLVGAITGDGADFITGNTLDNRIYGMRSDDTLHGQDGNDIVGGGRGADTMSGGADFDLVDYTGSDAGVTIDLSAAAIAERASGGHASGDTLLASGGINGFEGVIGSEHADRLAGDFRANTLHGKDGDDRLNGLGGDDTLLGGRGSDRVTGYFGNDLVFGGDSSDLLFGDQAVSYLPNGHIRGGPATLDNDALHNPLLLDGLFALSPDPNVENAASIPHLSIDAVGTGRFQYFSFSSFGANPTLIVDIDATSAYNSWIQLIDSERTVLYAQSDDMSGSPDPGSATLADSRIVAGLAPFSPATLVIEIGANVGGVFSPIPVGASYTLHVSLENPAPTGPGGADTLVGGRGADTLHGGFGEDILWGDQKLLSPAPGLVAKSADLGNDALEKALFVDGTYSQNLEATIVNSGLVRHTTVSASASGTTDFYAFTVTDADVNGFNRFDIDGANFNSSLRLYDADGTVLAENDDSAIDPGSGSSAGDAAIEYNFARAGTFYVSVSRSIAGNSFAPIDAGRSYQLHISLFDPLLVLAGGNDTLDGGAGIDVLRGVTEDDTLRVRAGEDGAGETYDGGLGIDTMEFFGSNYSINLRDDTFDSVDHLTFGDPGAGKTARILMNAGQFVGADWYVSVVDGSLRTDVLDILMGTETLLDLSIVAFSNFLGASDQVKIAGDGADETITGSDVRDVIDAGGGTDEMRGRGGSDSYYVDRLGDRVFEAAGEGTDDTVYSTSNYTLTAGQEIETLAARDQTLTTALNLTGNGIANRLIGNAGVNAIEGGGGIDRMYGRGGSDKYYVDLAGDQVFEAAGEGTDDAVYATANYTLAAGQEIETLAARDQTTTNALNLTGNGIGNRLIGNAGINSLNGLVGADRMFGLAGNDKYYVDDANDEVHEAVGGGTDDTVYATVNYTLASGQQVETLSARDPGAAIPLSLTGNEFQNRLIGTAGANLLDGGGEADALYGRGGNDKYYVNHVNDRVFEAAGEGTDDAVLATASYTLAGGQEIETLSAKDQATTNPLALTGNEIGNRVVGNAGVNVINGKGGADTLYGRGGSDSFLFETSPAGGNVDRIMDFVVADDTIRLENAVFAGLGNGPLAGAAFHTGAAAHDLTDRIIYNSGSGALLFDADGNKIGGVAAVQFASVSSGLILTEADFFVV